MVRSGGGVAGRVRGRKRWTNGSRSWPQPARCSWCPRKRRAASQGPYAAPSEREWEPRCRCRWRGRRGSHPSPSWPRRVLAVGIQRNVHRPVELGERALDDAHGCGVPVGLQRIDGDRRGHRTFPEPGTRYFQRSESGVHSTVDAPGFTSRAHPPSSVLLARGALIDDIHQLILRVQRNPVHLGQLRLVPFQNAQRDVVSLAPSCG